MSRTLHRIYLGLDERSAYNRQVLRGVREYVQSIEHWHCRVWDLTAEFWPAVEGWGPAGVIAECRVSRLSDLLAAWGRPAVNVSPIILDRCAIPTICPDEYAVGQQAANYLYARGYRHFATICNGERDDRLRREQGFRDTVSPVCMSYHSFRDFVAHRRLGRKRRAQTEEALTHWVRLLPKPVAVLTVTEQDAETLCDTCRLVGVPVPDELAILCPADDPLFCELTRPPLSSIALPGEQVGYEAARLLDRLLQGAHPPDGPRLLPPGSITTRASTRLVGYDPRVSEAIAFIEAHAHEPLLAGAIAEEVRVPLRTLAKLMRRERGRTLGEEIRLARLARAKQLLAETTMPISAIAEQTGFSHPSHLANTCRALLGMSPRAYRALCRGEG